MPKTKSSKSSVKSASRTTGSGVSNKRTALEQKAWYRLIKVVSFFVAGAYLLGVLLVGILISREYAWVTRGQPIPDGMQKTFRMQESGDRWGSDDAWEKKSKWNMEMQYRSYEPRFDWWRFARFVLGGWGAGILTGWLLSRAFYYIVIGKE